MITDQQTDWPTDRRTLSRIELLSQLKISKVGELLYRSTLRQKKGGDKWGSWSTISYRSLADIRCGRCTLLIDRNWGEVRLVRYYCFTAWQKWGRDKWFTIQCDINMIEISEGIEYTVQHSGAYLFIKKWWMYTIVTYNITRTVAQTWEKF